MIEWQEGHLICDRCSRRSSTRTCGGRTPTRQQMYPSSPGKQQSIVTWVHLLPCWCSSSTEDLRGQRSQARCPSCHSINSVKVQALAWYQPRKIAHQPYPFLIYHQTHEGTSAGSRHCLWHQYPCCTTPLYSTTGWSCKLTQINLEKKRQYQSIAQVLHKHDYFTCIIVHKLLISCLKIPVQNSQLS